MAYDVAVIVQVPAGGSPPSGGSSPATEPGEREHDPRFFAGDPITNTTTTSTTVPVATSAGPSGSLPFTGVGGGLVLLGIALVVAGVLARVVAR